MALRGKERIGTTIKNFKILNYKRENRQTFYFIKCGLCGNEKWMGYSTIMKPEVQGCGCYHRKISTKDLTGQTFGRLTVISPTKERMKEGQIVWLCKCVCGNKKKVSGSHLKQGNVRSCGCLAKERKFLNSYSAILEGKRESIDPKDQVGMIIKNHELLDYKYEKGKHYYFILCTWCGKKKWKEYSSIVSSRTESCGCQQKEFGQLDLTEKQFGRLTAIRPTEKRRDSSIIWHCVCSCGGEKQVVSSVLLDGRTKSCGCLQVERAVETANEMAEKVGVEGTKLNALTMKTPKSNKSGVRGVHWDKSSNKWRANIVFQGKRTYLGRFEHIEDAAAARKAAEEKYYKPMLEKYRDRLSPKQLSMLDNSD